MIDRYGLPRPDRDEWFGRPALWTRALERGCRTEDLASAYNVSTDAITLAVRRYLRDGKREQGKGQQDGDGVCDLVVAERGAVP